MGLTKDITSLIPFVLAQCHYWYFTSWPSRVADHVSKCTPIACLAFFILTDTKSRRRTNRGRIHPLRITSGLLFCLLGDFFLTYQDSEDHFLAGMLAFGIGHTCYIMALTGERNRIMLTTLLVSVMYGVALKFIIVPCVFNHKALAIPATVYGLMLVFLIWSAITRVPVQSTSPVATIASVCGVVGALIFSCSDMVLITTLTCDWVQDDEKSHSTVMMTYYLGQFFLTLSTIEARY